MFSTTRSRFTRQLREQQHDPIKSLRISPDGIRNGYGAVGCQDDGSQITPVDRSRISAVLDLVAAARVRVPGEGEDAVRFCDRRDYRPSGGVRQAQTENCSATGSSVSGGGSVQCVAAQNRAGEWKPSVTVREEVVVGGVSSVGRETVEHGEAAAICVH